VTVEKDDSGIFGILVPPQRGHPKKSSAARTSARRALTADQGCRPIGYRKPSKNDWSCRANPPSMALPTRQ
jgi:hypothetical protein